MLRPKIGRIGSGERGDTLIEVTIALAILGFVLLGSTAIAATAFRTGQTARERTQVSVAAQAQMEALRSFRDNHTWAEFRYGGSSVPGIEQAMTSPCSFDATLQCFHMKRVVTRPGTTEWVPQPGSMSSSVPTSVLEITSSTPPTQRNCAYDVELHYSFKTLGGTVRASNKIATRLANFAYRPGVGSGTCP